MENLMQLFHICKFVFLNFNQDGAVFTYELIDFFNQLRLLIK